MRRSVLAAAFTIAVACAPRDVAIRYLRSADYAFSTADRATIQRIVDSTTLEVRRVLPDLPAQLEVTVRPGADVIAETGETAAATPPAGVVWTVDPSRPGGVVKVAETQLRATLFHEFHHLVRWAAGSPRSIVEHAMFEGMATVFERDFAGVDPPWGKYPEDVIALEKELLALPSDASVRDWLFSHPDGRRWIGIKIGAYWVDRAAAKSGRSSATLAAMPTSEILSMVIAQPTATAVRVERLLDRPIITPELHPSLGPNIQGPSLIRVPEWVPARLGTYYLYFADHKGRYIRLAYADNLLGPWRIHVPGSLQLEGSHLLIEPPAGPADQLAKLRAAPQPPNLSHDAFTEATTPHIASPDVQVDHENRRIVMYYHGLNGLAQQVTRAATSSDGITFVARPEILGRTYFRAFPYDGQTYAMAMPGQFYRSKNPLSGFEEGPLLFNPNMRHAALLKRGNTLLVFWTQVGDVPERILLSTIDLSGDWKAWSAAPTVEVLRPEHEWEGATAPAVPSKRSTAYGRVNQLRDPAVFEEGGRTFLLYAVGGESGIAIAEVKFDR